MEATRVQNRRFLAKSWVGPKRWKPDVLKLGATVHVQNELPFFVNLIITHHLKDGCFTK